MSFLESITTAHSLRRQRDVNRAVALDSMTFVRGPFRILDDHNLSADHHTRAIIFTSNLGLTQPNPAARCGRRGLRLLGGSAGCRPRRQLLAGWSARSLLLGNTRTASSGSSAARTANAGTNSAFLCRHFCCGIGLSRSSYHASTKRPLSVTVSPLSAVECYPCR